MTSTLLPMTWDWPLLGNLLWLMALACVFSFGGANGPVIIVQNRLVDPGVLALQPFAFLLSLAYMLPGPKAAFVAGVGYYLAGIPGTVATLLGLIIPTVLLSSAANRALVRMRTIVERAKPATGYVLTGIIGATAYSTSRPLDIGFIEVGAIALVGYLIAWRDIEPLPLILTGLAVGGVRTFIAG